MDFALETKELFAKLAEIGMKPEGGGFSNETEKHCEFYKYNYATVSLSVYPDHYWIERYYDNENTNNRHVWEAKIPLDQAEKVIQICTILINTVKKCDPNLGMMEMFALDSVKNK